MVRQVGRPARLEARHCGWRGKTQHYAANRYPATTGPRLFAKNWWSSTLGECWRRSLRERDRFGKV